MTPLLVIGYGSELRRDDAVGRRVAERVADRHWPGVQTLSVHQLTPELAEPLSTAERVVFVDAGSDWDTSEPAVLRQLRPADRGSVLGHVADPEWLLALTAALYGRLPEAYLLAVPVADLAPGEGFSAEAERGLRAALSRLEEWFPNTVRPT